MPTSAVVRRAADSDLETVARLRLAFERITRDSGSLDEEARLAEIARLLGRDLEQGRLLCWVAEDGSSVVAQAALRLRGGRAGTADYGELINVYTDPARRGRGIGTALVAAAIAEARALGLDRLVLQATEDSRRIYERAGFRVSGRKMVLGLGLRP